MVKHNLKPWSKSSKTMVPHLQKPQSQIINNYGQTSSNTMFNNHQQPVGAAGAT
jgi:hypothetical protein